MKRHHILSIGILLALAVSNTAFAQDDDEVVYAEGAQQETVVKKAAPVKKQPQYPMKEVKGVVIDAATKAPLAGVQVQTLNDNRFTAMTNAQGEFTISVPTFATSLFVHTAQYLSQQVGIGEGSDLHIVMISDKFGIMYENGTNVSAAPVAKINNTTAQIVDTEIENILGADMRSINRSGGPGYGAAMFIRGLNSLNANAQPLIVVDGIVRDMQQTRMGLHDGDYNNLLLNINPEDIDNVQILKNGTALYGAKGGNGVIIITTKRGRSMATRIDANIGVGVSLQPRLPEVMNASQYRLYASELLGTYPNVNNYEVKYNFLNDD